MLRGYDGRATPRSYENHRIEQTGYASLTIPATKKSLTDVGDFICVMDDHLDGHRAF
jgi:hypothetical protein